MTSLFSHDDAVGMKLHGSDDLFKTIARICRWGADVVGLEEPTDQNIKTALLEVGGLATTQENVAAVRSAIDQLPKATPGLTRVRKDDE